ncbi:hypothetical protein DFJ73DRAFT_810158 [Zopfochytrium polystomum]|nr:hypothetical protein DFJ73DRAFT_810158 [Zopfochytrium polystomum]
MAARIPTHLSEWVSSAVSKTQPIVQGDFVSPYQMRLLRILIDGLLDPSAESSSSLPTVVNPGWHLTLFPTLLPEQRLSSDGYLPAFAPPAPYLKRMWAGGRMEFVSPIAMGRNADLRLSCADVAIKRSKSGSGERVFVSEQWDISQEGQLKVRDVRTIVYMENEPKSDSAPGDGPGKRKPAVTALPTPHFSATVQPSIFTLFRYSALTYNAHLIHYDAGHARQVEGHAGLLVHGPLTCTLLLEFLTRQAVERKGAQGGGGVLRTLEYRAVKPVVLGGRLSLNASPEAGTADSVSRDEEKRAERWRAWATDSEGDVVMTAHASIERHE